MNILVTGAAGCIGSHLVDVLLKKGHNVLGVDNLSYGTLANLERAIDNPNFSFHNTNVEKLKIKKITDPYHLNNNRKITNSLNNLDVIFHLASYKKAFRGTGLNPSEIMINNSKMIETLMELSNINNSYFIFTSTSDIYGNSKTFKEDEPITIGPPTNSRYSYALSKLFDEQYILNNIQEKNIIGAIARIFGCSSPRANKDWSGGHVPLFIKQAKENKDINIHGDGLQTRSISSAEDIAYGLSLILENKENCIGEIINLGTDQQTTVKEVAEYIIQKTNSTSKINFIPRQEIFGDYKEILIRFANTDKAKKILGFKITKSTFEVIDEIIKSK